jgi:WD40 repeat protein/tetratricopeptide (TPR) repeat protein
MKLVFLGTLISGLISSTTLAVTATQSASSAVAQQPTPKDLSVNSWNRPALRLTLPTAATQLEFSQDGNHLLTTTLPGQPAELWNLTTNKKEVTVPAKAGFAYCNVALSADGQYAAALLHSIDAPSATRTKRKIEVKVWNLKTGQTQWTSPIQDHVILAGQTTVCEIEFSPNSQILATSISSPSYQLQPGVRLWSVPQGKLLSVTNSKTSAIDNLAFTRDSSMLGFSTRVDNQAQAHLWNLNDRKLQVTLKAEGNPPPGIVDVFFSPNQQDVLAYTDDGIFDRLYRWQVQTGKLKNISPLAPDRTDRLLGLSPDGETYVYGGDVTGYHIGNLRSNLSLDFPQPLSPSSATRKVVFSPDGQQMAISNEQNITILRSQPSTVPPVSDAVTRQIAELAALATAPDANKPEVIKQIDRLLVNRVDRRTDRNPEDAPRVPQVELLLRDVASGLQPNQKEQFIQVLDQVTAQIERIRDPKQKIELLSSLPLYYQQLGASDRTTTTLTRAIQLSLKQTDALDRATKLGTLLTSATQLQQASKIAPFFDSIESVIVPLIRPGQVGLNPTLFQVTIPCSLAQAYADAGQFAKALRLLDRVAVLSPPKGGDPVLARLYLQIKRPDKAAPYLNALVKQPELLVEDSSYALLAAATDKLKHPLAQQIFDQGWKFSNRSLFYSQEDFANDYLKAGGNPSRVRK